MLVGQRASANGGRRWRSRALTLAESLLATILLATTVTVVVGAVLAGHQQTCEAGDTRRAVALVEAMMEEILALPYDDPDGASAPGPEAGESSRAAFDNIDDYHGYSEAAGAVADAAGSPYPAAYAVYDRSVTIAAASIRPTGFATAAPGLSVTVSVGHTGRTVASASRFVAQPPS